MDINRIDTAEVILNNMISEDPNYSQAYATLAEINGRIKGNYPLAIEYLLKAHELDPNDVGVLENLGIVYAIQGNFNESIDCEGSPISGEIFQANQFIKCCW